MEKIQQRSNKKETKPQFKWKKRNYLQISFKSFAVATVWNFF